MDPRRRFKHIGYYYCDLNYSWAESIKKWAKRLRRVTVYCAGIGVYTRKVVEATEAKINERVEEWNSKILTHSERRKLVIDKWTNVKNSIWYYVRIRQR